MPTDTAAHYCTIKALYIKLHVILIQSSHCILNYTAVITIDIILNYRVEFLPPTKEQSFQIAFTF